VTIILSVTPEQVARWEKLIAEAEELADEGEYAQVADIERMLAEDLGQLIDEAVVDQAQQRPDEGLVWTIASDVLGEFLGYTAEQARSNEAGYLKNLATAADIIRRGLSACRLMVDSDGRPLCPRCGAGLYCAVEVYASDVIPHWEGEYGAYDGLDADPDDARHRASDLTRLYCSACPWEVDPREVQVVVAGG